MEIVAKDTYLKISPQKLRPLTTGLKGLPVEKAQKKVFSYSQSGRLILEKLFKQAVANATNNFKLAKSSLFVKKIEVNEGPRMKRRDVSHGARFDSGIIQKRMSHVLLVLESKETVVSQKQKVAQSPVNEEKNEEKIKKVANRSKRKEVKSGTKS